MQSVSVYCVLDDHVLILILPIQLSIRSSIVIYSPGACILFQRGDDGFFQTTWCECAGHG